MFHAMNLSGKRVRSSINLLRMEPVSGEAEVEDMNECFARVKAEGQH
jgi:hypothetical protein